MATTHDHSALIRNIQLATGVTTVAATGLLAASAHMLFRFAIDTQWKHSIFHQALIAPDREGGRAMVFRNETAGIHHQPRWA